MVAIELLHGKWVGHEEIVQRSRDEARVLELLHHRNIVRVEDLTSINGQCAIIMEYLEGVDLKSLLRYCKDSGSMMPRKVAFEIVASTATALDAAFHRKTLNSGQALKLIHRDIKPSNVMVTVAGEVKVLDFGTARAQFEHREAGPSAGFRFRCVHGSRADDGRSGWAEGRHLLAGCDALRTPRRSGFRQDFHSGRSLMSPSTSAWRPLT